MYIFYFDCGTSNTRGYVLCDGKILSSNNRNVGAKDVSINKHNKVLLDAMYEIYTDSIKEAGITSDDVSDIYASGMITSPFGLKEVPHMCVPVDVNVIRDSMYEYEEDILFHRKIKLIRGLKTLDGKITRDNLSDLNNVRGEEPEVFGIFNHIPKAWKKQSYLIIIPGSHTHGLMIENDTIIDILSTFSGEIFHAITSATVLSGSTAIEDKNKYRPDMGAVSYGCDLLNRYGIARAVYMVHAMKIFDVENNHIRRDALSGIIAAATVDSFLHILDDKWKNIENIAIYGDETMIKAYELAFSSVSDKYPFNLFLLNRNEHKCGIEGFYKIAKG